MATADDVAAYILQNRGPMTAMKMQKLVYYSQAWHLVWAEQPLFDEQIQAWANGPVVYDLYRKHRGNFRVSTWEHGDTSNLTQSEQSTIDIVLDFYGDKDAHWLSELTHREAPWRNARAGLSETDRSSREITPDSMFEYYDGLTSAQ